MLDAMTPRFLPRAAALAFLAASAAFPALVQDRPPTLPTRDVAVTYAVSGAAANALPGGAPGALRLAWDAAGRRLRIGADDVPQAMIVDLTVGEVVILDDKTHAALTLPLGSKAADGIALSSATFKRQGAEQVAGYACTDYAVQDRRGAGTLCLTTDGVPLKGDGTWQGRAGRFVATQVEYGAQPDGLFRPPAGFVQLALPKNLGAAR
jgi:hypothetical protein